MKRFETLDAFRGLAAIMIVLYHSYFYTSTMPNPFIRQSGIFVDFFFVLSGFVVAYSYKDRILNGIGFKKFTLFRFARLYPLHLFTLLVWVPFVAVKLYLYKVSPSGNDPVEIFNGYTFFQNLLLLQGFSHPTSWNYPSWSIGVEFYTYLLFYFVIFLTVRFPASGRYFLYVVIVCVSYYLLIDHQNEIFVFKKTFRCIGGFFLGVLIYELYRAGSISIKHKVLATFLEVVVFLGMIYFVINIENGYEYRYYTMATFVIIVYLFSIESIGLVSKLLMKDLFQYLGKISYSIYMTHAIILAVGTKVLNYVFDFQQGKVALVTEGIVSEHAIFINFAFVLLVVLFSGLTYRYIELPGQLYIKKRFNKNDK